MTVRVGLWLICILVGASGIGLAGADTRGRSLGEGQGKLLILQMVPAPAFSIAPDAATRLTNNEIETIAVRYRQLRVTGTIVIATDETIDGMVGDSWRAVFVVTRPLGKDETPSLMLPSEPSLLYLQGRPDEPTDRGWIVSSPEDHQHPRVDWENHRRISFAMSDNGNSMRYAVLDGEHEVAKGVSCAWP